MDNCGLLCPSEFPFLYSLNQELNSSACSHQNLPISVNTSDKNPALAFTFDIQFLIELGLGKHKTDLYCVQNKDNYYTNVKIRP